MATKKATSTTKKAPTKSKSVVKKPATVTSAPTTARFSSLSAHIQSAVQSVGFWRSLGAEFLGTLLLATVIVAGQGQPIFVLFGLAGLVLLFGAVSGAHFNPAITIGAWVTRRIGWLRAIAYIAAQVLGATLAWVILSTFIGGAPAQEESQYFSQAAPSLFKAAEFTAYSASVWYIFFAEVLGTAILGYAIASATRNARDKVTASLTAGFGIFIALMVGVTVAGYVGGSAVLNPAIAVTLQAYDWSSFWPFAIYAIGATLGGVIGFILHDVITPKNA